MNFYITKILLRFLFVRFAEATPGAESPSLASDDNDIALSARDGRER
jgi:hypothetical protein